MHIAGKQSNSSSDHLTVRKLSPGKVFAYWHLQDKKIRFICRYFQISEKHISRIIRLIDLTRLEESKVAGIYEITLPPGTYSWMFKGVLQDRDYVVELGVRINNLVFFPLLRSNVLSASGQSRGQAIQIDNQTPEWTEHVSTYSFYGNLEGRSWT